MDTAGSSCMHQPARVQAALLHLAQNVAEEALAQEPRRLALTLAAQPFPACRRCARRQWRPAHPRRAALGVNQPDVLLPLQAR